MNADEIKPLAARLDVDLGSPGVCPMCLSFVASALEEGDERRIAAQVRKVTPDLWADGLGPTVRAALVRAEASGTPGAAEALRSLDQNGARSPIFTAVIQRLARELKEESSRAFRASLN